MARSQLFLSCNRGSSPRRLANIMQKTLILKSDDQDDDRDMERMLKLSNACMALEDFRNFLRSESKYGEHSDEVREYLEKIREKFYVCFRENEADIFL